MEDGFVENIAGTPTEVRARQHCVQFRSFSTTAENSLDRQRALQRARARRTYLGSLGNECTYIRAEILDIAISMGAHFFWGWGDLRSGENIFGLFVFVCVCVFFFFSKSN